MEVKLHTFNTKVKEPQENCPVGIKRTLVPRAGKRVTGCKRWKRAQFLRFETEVTLVTVRFTETCREVITILGGGGGGGGREE